MMSGKFHCLVWCWYMLIGQRVLTKMHFYYIFGGGLTCGYLPHCNDRRSSTPGDFQELPSRNTQQRDRDHLQCGREDAWKTCESLYTISLHLRFPSSLWWHPWSMHSLEPVDVMGFLPFVSLVSSVFWSLRSGTMAATLPAKSKDRGSNSKFHVDFTQAPSTSTLATHQLQRLQTINFNACKPSTSTLANHQLQRLH